MYLGVVTNRHFKSERIKKFYNDYSDYPNLSDSIGYISVDLCNQNGKLNSIFISTSKCSYQGDLVNLVYENGNWIVKEIIDDYNVKKLSINQILQLEKLIELEKLKLKEEKKEYAESYLKRDSLFFEIVRRELRIEDLVKKFNLAIKNVSTKIEYIKLKKYSSYRQSIEFIEKIIYSLRTNELSLFFWLMYASSILHLSNNNINEELLTRAIELLLNVKIANNEINELKLQLEQQLKQKLTELKGKQKRLV